MHNRVGLGTFPLSGVFNTIQIKKVTAVTDADAIAVIVAEVLNHDFPYQPATIRQFRDHIFNQKFFRKGVKAKDQVYLAAFIDQKIVGFVSFKTEFGGAIFVDWLAVLKEHRSLGIGSALVRAVDDWAQAHHYHYLYLFTETAKNIAFYQSRGYKQVGIHQNAWFGETEYILAKQLRPYNPELTAASLVP